MVIAIPVHVTAVLSLDGPRTRDSVCVCVCVPECPLYGNSRHRRRVYPRDIGCGIRARSSQAVSVLTHTARSVHPLSVGRVIHLLASLRSEAARHHRISCSSWPECVSDLIEFHRG